MTPTFETWLPVPELPQYFGGHSIHDSSDAFVVRLHSYPRDLVLTFNARSILAYRVHDEHVHPSFNQESAAPQSVRGHLLIIQNSEWLQSFSDSQILYFQHPTHYYIYTRGNTIDVLSTSSPDAKWELVSE